MGTIYPENPKIVALFRFVLGNDLFLCGKHIYNHFRDCKDVGSYLCGDRIVDVVAFYADKVLPITHRMVKNCNLDPQTHVFDCLRRSHDSGFGARKGHP